MLNLRKKLQTRKEKRDLLEAEHQRELAQLQEDHVFVKFDGQLIEKILFWSPRQTDYFDNFGFADAKCKNLIIRRNSWETDVEHWRLANEYWHELPQSFCEIFGNITSSCLEMKKMRSQLPSQSIVAPDSSDQRYANELQCYQALKEECNRLEFDFSAACKKIFCRVEAEYLKCREQGNPSDYFQSRLKAARNSITDVSRLLEGFEELDKSPG